MDVKKSKQIETLAKDGKLKDKEIGKLNTKISNVEKTLETKDKALSKVAEEIHKHGSIDQNGFVRVLKQSKPVKPVITPVKKQVMK